MNRSHQTALWAGLSAFFGSLLAIGTFDVLQPGQALEYLGAILVAFITAGGVYSKQRLDDAKIEYDGDFVVTEDHRGNEIVTLELNDDPGDTSKKNELRFKVKNLPELKEPHE